MPYMLEVQRLTDVFVHVGYMAMVCRTKLAMAQFYAHYNPHMPPINASTQWKSDTHVTPHSSVRFVVRVYDDEELTVPGFGALHAEEKMAADSLT